MDERRPLRGRVDHRRSRTRELAKLSLHLGHELRQVDHRAAYGAAADLLGAIVGGDAKRIKAAIERLELRCRDYLRPYTRRCAMLDVDVRAHVHFAVGTKR